MGKGSVRCCNRCLSLLRIQKRVYNGPEIVGVDQLWEEWGMCHELSHLEDILPGLLFFFFSTYPTCRLPPVTCRLARPSPRGRVRENMEKSSVVCRFEEKVRMVLLKRTI